MYLFCLLILVDLFTVIVLKKISLNVSKGKSEVVNRMTDNTMAKKKKDKWTNNELQNTAQKTKKLSIMNHTKNGANFVLIAVLMVPSS